MHWLVLAILGAQAAVLIWNLIYWKRRRLSVTEMRTRLSVLIPVRNEVENLPVLLAALRRQSSPADEIIVCDDGSDDGTDTWLEKNAAEYSFRWFRADPKPDGWFGKSWACQSLAQRAMGDWLLFLDADLEPSPEFLGTLSAVLPGTSATLVTAFQRQRPTTVADGLLQAMVPFSVFTTLPLRLAERHRHPAFAFAHGQLIAFRRDDYARLQPHKHVRDRVLEDVALARLVKRDNGQVLILDATRLLSARMYKGLRDAVDGFSKNAVSICGNRIYSAAAIAALLILLYLMPLIVLPTGAWWSWLAVLLAACLFATSCWMVRLPIWYGPLYPLAILLAEWVIWRSIIWHWRGSLRWKGRLYPIR